MTDATARGEPAEMPPDGDPAKVTATRRGKKAPVAPVRIAGHETVEMTPQQYDNAVEALAVLLSRHRGKVSSHARDASGQLPEAEGAQTH